MTARLSEIYMVSDKWQTISDGQGRAPQVNRARRFNRARWPYCRSLVTDNSPLFRVVGCPSVQTDMGSSYGSEANSCWSQTHPLTAPAVKPVIICRTATNVKIDAAARPGAINGNSTLVKTRIGPQPSIDAASSSSIGTWNTNP